MLHNHITYSLSQNDLRMVKSVPQGGNWKNIPLDIPSKRLEQIRASGGRTTLYGRLESKRPSYTITTYFNRPGNGTYIHPIHDRVLTAREAARFQSFPDSYVFHGGKLSLCKQIGNAVPPILAYNIARQIKTKTKTSKLLDLFSGAGGLSLGFQWAGYKVIAANDNFKQACQTYRANHTETVLVEGSITDEEVKKDLLKISQKNKVDIVVGGPPCQGFSHAGKRMIDDPRNFLYKEFVYMVKSIKPKVFVMENVEGILTINEGKTYEEIKNHFRSLGYSVTGRKLHAVQYGVPQKRKRVVIIGTLKGNSENLFPEPLILDQENYVSTDNAISDLLNVSTNEELIVKKVWKKPTHQFQEFVRGFISVEQYLDSFI